MSAPPTGKDIHTVVAAYQKATNDLADLRKALDAGTGQAVFTPQPYPLFLADWSDGNPLVGRVVGWSAEPGRMPHPVVVFDQHGVSTVPLLVNMVLGMGGAGPMWLRDTAADALAEANAYVPPRQVRR